MNFLTLIYSETLTFTYNNPISSQLSLEVILNIPSRNPSIFTPNCPHDAANKRILCAFSKDWSDPTTLTYDIKLTRNSANIDIISGNIEALDSTIPIITRAHYIQLLKIDLTMYTDDNLIIHAIDDQPDKFQFIRSTALGIQNVYYLNTPMSNIIMTRAYINGNDQAYVAQNPNSGAYPLFNTVLIFKSVKMLHSFQQPMTVLSNTAGIYGMCSTLEVCYLVSTKNPTVATITDFQIGTVYYPISKLAFENLENVLLVNPIFQVAPQPGYSLGCNVTTTIIATNVDTMAKRTCTSGRLATTNMIVTSAVPTKYVYDVQISYQNILVDSQPLTVNFNPTGMSNNIIMLTATFNATYIQIQDVMGGLVGNTAFSVSCNSNEQLQNVNNRYYTSNGICTSNLQMINMSSNLNLYSQQTVSINSPATVQLQKAVLTIKAVQSLTITTAAISGTINCNAVCSYAIAPQTAEFNIQDSTATTKAKLAPAAYMELNVQSYSFVIDTASVQYADATAIKVKVTDAAGFVKFEYSNTFAQSVVRYVDLKSGDIATMLTQVSNVMAGKTAIYAVFENPTTLTTITPQIKLRVTYPLLVVKPSYADGSQVAATDFEFLTATIGNVVMERQLNSFSTNANVAGLLTIKFNSYTAYNMQSGGMGMKTVGLSRILRTTVNEPAQIISDLFTTTTTTANVPMNIATQQMAVSVVTVTCSYCISQTVIFSNTIFQEATLTLIRKPIELRFVGDLNTIITKTLRVVANNADYLSSNGVVSFNPIQNSTNIIVYFNDLIVLQRQINTLLNTQTIILPKIITVAISSCGTSTLTTTYLTTTRQITCSGSSGNAHFIASTQGTITLSGDLYNSKTVAFNPATDLPLTFENTKFTMLEKKQFILQIKDIQGVLQSQLGFSVQVQGTTYTTNNGLITLQPPTENSLVEVTFEGLLVFSQFITIQSSPVDIRINPIVNIQSPCIDLGNSFSVMLNAQTSQFNCINNMLNAYFFFPAANSPFSISSASYHSFSSTITVQAGTFLNTQAVAISRFSRLYLKSVSTMIEPIKFTQISYSVTTTKQGQPIQLFFEADQFYIDSNLDFPITDTFTVSYTFTGFGALIYRAATQTVSIQKLLAEQVVNVVINTAKNVIVDVGADASSLTFAYKGIPMLRFADNPLHVIYYIIDNNLEINGYITGQKDAVHLQYYQELQIVDKENVFDAVFKFNTVVNIQLTYEKTIDMTYFDVRVNGYAAKLMGTKFVFQNSSITSLIGDVLTIKVIDISKKFYEILVVKTDYVPYTNMEYTFPLDLILTTLNLTLSTQLSLEDFQVSLDSYKMTNQNGVFTLTSNYDNKLFEQMKLVVLYTNYKVKAITQNLVLTLGQTNLVTIQVEETTDNYFSFYLSTYNKNCITATTQAIFPNDFRVTSYGCKPVFYWENSSYILTVNDIITISSNNGVQLTFNVIEQDGNPVVSITPVTKNTVTPLFTLNVNITEMMANAKSVSGECPNYLLNITLAGVVVFADYTYSQCVLRIVYAKATAPTSGSTLLMTGTAPGAQTISLEIVLDDLYIEQMKTGGLNYIAPPITAGGIAAIVIGVIIIIAIIVFCCYYWRKQIGAKMQKWKQQRIDKKNAPKPPKEPKAPKAPKAPKPAKAPKAPKAKKGQQVQQSQLIEKHDEDVVQEADKVLQ